MGHRLFSITYFLFIFLQVGTGLVWWVGLVVGVGEKTAKLHYSLFVFGLNIAYSSPMFWLF